VGSNILTGQGGEPKKNRATCRGTVRVPPAKVALNTKGGVGFTGEEEKGERTDREGGGGGGFEKVDCRD